MKNVKSDLEGEVLNDFKLVKKFTGIKSDAEAIRYCIRVTARNIKENETQD